MRHNIKKELTRSMDELHFSRETKESMVDMLLTQAKEQNMKRTYTNRKRLTLVPVAAAMLVMTLTGAAVFTRWSKTAQNTYNPSEEIKSQAEKSGLSVMLEETKGTENPNEVLSVTDNGITVTAVQTIVDNYGAELIFRVEGFELPEGKLPHSWPVVTIDGKDRFGGSQSGWFYDGLTSNEEGKTVYAATGLPVQSDETGCLILDYVADDGSMEYIYHINFEETDGWFFGKEIAFTFHSFDFQSEQKAGPSIPQVEGNWELKWTLTGTEDHISITPNANIGDSDVILLDAEIGQLSLRTRYQLKDYWEGWDELVELPQAVCGIRLKDGTEHVCAPSTSGFEDQENMIYFIESRMFDTILDVNQVESLMFHKGWENDANGNPTVQTFYYIPIQ